MTQNTNPHIILIGAGPIGLLYAWGIKYLNPKFNVVVLEKYKEYQRNHTLNMKHKQLLAFMKATNTEQHPKLVNLLKQLKKNPHIRTDKLQKIFTELAAENKVEIHYEKEITKENIQSEIFAKYPQAQLIIGADGTHSATSQSLFPENNQIKHKFDYVLQLRYEIQGEHKTEGINVIDFYQQMARHGLIANEYVGVFQDNKTPITMQMMISEDDYNLLKKATSKKPIRPYQHDSQSADETQPEEQPKLPFHLQQFINTYLCKKNYDISGSGQKIDEQSIKISVNEAPATQAKQIICTYDNKTCLLVGDAALGLSYFKGLNAGVEAAAKFFSILKASIIDSFNNKELMKEGLNKYQKWMINEFAPLKIREVGGYSFWRIRSLMKWINAVHQLKYFSYGEIEDNLEPALQDYFNYYRNDTLLNMEKNWQPYPHRSYKLVKIGQFELVPPEYHLKKLSKLFVDYLKPYKGDFHLMKDIKQPFFGFANFSMGLFKIFHSIFSLNYKRLFDGLLSTLRGAIELITTPLTWFIKPLFRGIATLNHGGYKKIEENTNLKNLAQYGLDLINANPINFAEPQELYKVLAICNDLHRKFEKSVKQGQKSNLLVTESTAFSSLRNDSLLNSVKVKDYFTLFAVKNTKVKDSILENHLNTLGI